MVEGAQIVCRCGRGCEGPWEDGDLLYVCLIREANAVVRVSPDGKREPWGAHMIPAMYRDLVSGAAQIMWRDARFVDAINGQWQAAATSTRPPVRATG